MAEPLTPTAVIDGGCGAGRSECPARTRDYALAFLKQDLAAVLD
jgi:hypothetical protein